MKERGGLLVAGGDGPPLLEPGPEPLDQVAVVVDPLRAGDGRLVALRRDRGPCAHAPDVLAEARGWCSRGRPRPTSARPAAGRGAARHGAVRAPGRARSGRRSARPAPVGDHASLGAIAATRAAKRFTMVSLSLRSPLRAAPAAFWCARTLVPSRNTMPSCTPRSCTRLSRRSQTPSARPADEDLGGAPPGSEVGRDGAPLGPVLMPPQDGGERAAQVLRWRLALRAGKPRPAAPEPPIARRSASRLLARRRQNASPANRFKRRQALANAFCNLGVIIISVHLHLTAQKKP